MVTRQFHDLKIVGSIPISGIAKKLEYSQVVRRSFLVRIFKGSNPFIPKREIFFIYCYLSICKKFRIEIVNKSSSI